jgi:hypothetical protein
MGCFHHREITDKMSRSTWLILVYCLILQMQIVADGIAPADASQFIQLKMQIFQIQ